MGLDYDRVRVHLPDVRSGRRPAAKFVEPLHRSGEIAIVDEPLVIVRKTANDRLTRAVLAAPPSLPRVLERCRQFACSKDDASFCVDVHVRRETYALDGVNMIRQLTHIPSFQRAEHLVSLTGDRR